MHHTDIFENRRSINFFDSNKPLPDGLLKQIIDLAVLAPSAFNLQPWRIIAVETSAAKERLLPLTMKQPKIVEAPVTLILVADYNGWNEHNPIWGGFKAMMGAEAAANYLAMAQQLYGSTPERSIKFAESNAGLLAMSIMYAAQTLGVESHAMSGIDFAGIKKEFELGDSEEVVMLVCLGYLAPGKELYPRARRLGFQEMVTRL